MNSADTAQKAPARPAALVDLLNAVSDTLVVFTVAGVVRVANDAARERFGPHLAALPLHPDLKPLLRDATLGNATLPRPVHLEFDMDGGEPLAIDGLITRGLSGVDFAFVAPPAGMNADELAGQAVTDVMRRLVDVLRLDLLDPVKSLLRALTGSLAGAANPAKDVLLLGADVVGKLSKLVDLIDMFGADAIAGTDRVEIEPLVRDAWAGVEPLAVQRNVAASLTGFGGVLPPIYGNRRLLVRAVQEGLMNAVENASQARTGLGKVNIEVHASLIGEHVRLSVRNHGLGRLPQLGDRVFLPFNRATVPVQSGSGRPGGLGIGLPLCRRILELHGGFLRIDPSRDETTELMIELHTGAPRGDAGGLDVAQAQRYAADLAKLMARRRKGG